MIEYLESIDETSGRRKKTILEMIRLKYTPYSTSAIYKILRKKKEYKIVANNSWNKAGRPSLLDETSIRRIAEEVQDSPGQAYGKSQLNDIIVHHIKQSIIDSGHVPVNIPDQRSHGTLNNYIAQIAMMHDVAIVKSSNPKTNTRYAAENSIRGVFSNALLTASTHFVAVPDEDTSIKTSIQSKDEEIQQLYNMVNEYGGGVPYVPVKSPLIFSTDDTTTFIFEGSETKPSLFCFINLC